MDTLLPIIHGDPHLGSVKGKQIEEGLASFLLLLFTLILDDW